MKKLVALMVISFVFCGCGLVGEKPLPVHGNWEHPTPIRMGNEGEAKLRLRIASDSLTGTSTCQFPDGTEIKAKATLNALVDEKIIHIYSSTKNIEEKNGRTCSVEFQSGIFTYKIDNDTLFVTKDGSSTTLTFVRK